MLLPDAAELRAATDRNVEVFHRDGLEAAFGAFMANAGYNLDDADLDAPDAGPPPGEPTERDIANGARFFAHELQPTTRYVPDVAALADGPTRVVIGLGVESGHLLTARTSTTLAGLLGTSVADFPGEHVGFLGQPVEFAAALRKVLGR